MQVDWENMFKRYVFNATKTPYLVPASKLNRLQAQYEIFVYCLFLAVMFGILAVASISPKLPHAGATGVTFVALLLCAAAIIFGFTKHPMAAATTAVAPVACMIYLIMYGFHPKIGDGDKVLLGGFLLLWLRYNWRMLAIARAFPDLPDPPPPPPPPTDVFGRGHE